VRDRAAELASAAGVTIEHIAKKHIRKEDVVAKILAVRGDHPGLVHIISAMEACNTYKPWHDKQTHRTFLRPDTGKCLHYYFYFIDAELGLIYLRVPTWCPFRLQFYCNGHSWLARQVTAAGIGFTPEELKALDIESSKVIDLEKFVPQSDLDPVYFDSSYYLYPDGPIAIEMLRVIGSAIAEAGVVGLGRLTLSRRERMVVVEPRRTGMALFTLRAAEEVRTAQFGMAESELAREMVAIAKAIIAQRTGSFDPTMYRDRYQEALRELIEAKMKGLTVKPKEIAAPPPVIDLMAAFRGKSLNPSTR
jgi:Ku protein